MWQLGSMKSKQLHSLFPYLRVRDYAWWIWLLVWVLLVLGLTRDVFYLSLCLAVCLGQFAYFLVKEASFTAFPVQLRGFFTLFLVAYAYSPMRPALWTMVLGVGAMLTCGYCPLARLMYLLPWNRGERLTRAVLAHTFFRAPDLAAARRAGHAAAGCPGGVCSLEVQLGKVGRTELPEPVGIEPSPGT